MSLIAVHVNDARAVLDDDKNEFVIEVRLANGQELRLSSTPTPEKMAALREAMTAAAPEPTKSNRRRRRRRNKTPGTESPS